jgi:hypothetical protein
MSNCRVCNSSDLITVLSLGEQYLSEFRDDDKKPPRFPLDLVICNDCKQVQLKDTVPQNLLYTDNYGYRSGINTTMRNHLRDLVFDLLKFVPLEFGDLIIDIGSNDGTLLKWYPSHYTRLGYDLIPKFEKYYAETGIHYGAFQFEPKYLVRKAKIITAISMFYDLDNPVQFMQDMADGLDKDGAIVVQQNYLLSMLKCNGFDNILAEHLCYHSVSSMQKIVEQCGLEIFDVRVNDLNGGSFRTYISHKNVGYGISASVKEQLWLEKMYGIERLKCYEDFSKRIAKLKNETIKFINNAHDIGKRIVALAASTRGNTLLQYYGLDNKLIYAAVERNEEKIGKKIASCGIPIISEEQFMKDMPEYALSLSWYFRDELIHRYADYRKKGGKIIFPLPKFEIIG